MNWKVDLLKRSNEQYHNGETPILTDAEYDSLNEDTPKQEVGAIPDSSFDKVEHQEKMLSLDNVFNSVELDDWLVKLSQKLERHQAGQLYVLEYKLDGIALALTYRDLKLVKALTRGNGLVGHDVTEHALRISSIPKELHGEFPSGELVFYGEVYIRDGEFEAYKDTGFVGASNPRNVTAGIMRQSKPENTHLLRFAPHGASRNTFNVLGITKYTELVHLLNLAFDLSDLHSRNAVGELGINRICEDFTDRRETLQCATDGIVIKIDNIFIRDQLGSTTHHPLWAVALKFNAIAKLTTLREVGWPVGRTGVVTPVAKFDPIEIEGVMVGLATLHNAEFVERIGVQVGGVISVIRSGGVIPQITAAIPTPDLPPVILPTHCSSCQSLLRRVGPNLLCLEYTTCLGQKASRLTAFVSRDILNIRGMGPEICDLLVTEEVVDEPYDLLTLSLDSLARMIELLGEKVSYSIFEQINKIENISLELFISTLMIPGLGPTKAKLLADAIGSVEDFYHLVKTDDYDSLLGVSGVGHGLINSLKAYAKPQLSLISSVAGGHGPFKVIPIGVTNNNATGESYVLTGTFDKPRKEIARMLHEMGHVVQSAVSSRTTAVLTGSKPGKKVADAVKIGIPVIPWDTWSKTI